MTGAAWVKGFTTLTRTLSIGRAAGLMNTSNAELTIQNTGNPFPRLPAKHEWRMKMTDEQKRAFEEAKRALEFPSHTSGSFAPKTLISTRSLFELEALARIGAAVQPRPFSEAPRDGSTLIDTAGRAFHWGSIRGKEGFKWKHRGDDEWPWAETVGYFYAMSAIPQVKP